MTNRETMIEAVAGAYREATPTGLRAHPQWHDLSPDDRLRWPPRRAASWRPP